LAIEGTRLYDPELYFIIAANRECWQLMHLPSPSLAGHLHTRASHQTTAMKDSIVQEVRDAKAAVVADFEFDLTEFFAWAKTHAAAEQKARHWLPTGQKQSAESKGVNKRRKRPSGV
jgi:hypothetical protein